MFWQPPGSVGSGVGVMDGVPVGVGEPVGVGVKTLGHPLLCDTAYGGIAPFPPEDSGEPPVLTRCALHAARLVIRHPRTGQPIEFVAPLPADMSAALALLRQR